MKEMFSTLEEKFGVKYSNDIGDGDSKTFKAIPKLNTYRNELTVVKNECMGHTQNTSESFNATLWWLSPKHLHSGLKNIKMSAYIAAAIFNEGYISILRVMNKLNIIVGTYSKVSAENTDEAWVARQNRMSLSETKTARTARKQQQIEDNYLAFRGGWRLIICAWNCWLIGKSLKLIVLSYWKFEHDYLETAFSKTARAVAHKVIIRSDWNVGKFLSITLLEGCT